MPSPKHGIYNNPTKTYSIWLDGKHHARYQTREGAKQAWKEIVGEPYERQQHGLQRYRAAQPRRTGEDG